MFNPLSYISSSSSAVLTSIDDTMSAYESYNNNNIYYDFNNDYNIRYLQDNTTTISNATSNTTNIMNRNNTITETATEEESSDIIGVIISNIFLFFLIFGLSGTVDVKQLKKQITNKFAIFVGVSMQFIVMPILGFTSVKIFQNLGMPSAVAISLLVVTSSPGGSYSNWWCSTFNADLALSVAMTTVSSILAIGFLPMNLFLYTYLAFGMNDNNDENSTDSDIKSSSEIVKLIDFTTLFMSLAIVLSAIIGGLIAGSVYDSALFHERCNKLGSISGLCLIFFSIFYSSGGNGTDSNFINQNWTFYVGTALPCLFGMVIANIVARTVKLSPPEVVAIAIECSYQNTGIGTTIAISMFSDPTRRAQAVAVPLFYGIIEAVFICIYCLYSWKMGVS